MNNSLNALFKKLKNKKVGLCGVGESNFPLIEMFLNKGIDVYVFDKRTKDQLCNNIYKLEKRGVKLFLGDNYLSNLSKMDVIFRTPGMSFYTPEFLEIRKKGIIITSEMEVFFKICPCDIIAVTGSDGKTTTTTIISEILRASNKNVHLGGNIGKPLLPIIEQIKPTDVAVVELSSFQLISMRESPDIAVVTNLAPNHLDVHKDMSEYISAKKNILLHQDAFSRAVLNSDNEITKGFSDITRGDTLFFSRKEKCNHGVFVSEDEFICVSLNGKLEKIMKTSDITLPGKHNLENYLAAIAALWGYADKDAIKNVAKEFKGVEHRIEFVREVCGVKYYNDSIASSPTRTASGTLSLFDEKIILIAGGYDKKIPFDELGPIITEKVKTLILMGATADKIEKAVKSSSAYGKNNPNIIHVKNMEEAVEKARCIACEGDIVAMSPACASYDLYKNFSERGRHFKEIVNKL